MIHPHFIVTDCLDHQVHFSHRGMTGSTLITMIPVLLDRYGERVTAALHCYTKAVDDQRPARHHPGSAGGLVADFRRRAPLTLHRDN